MPDTMMSQEAPVYRNRSDEIDKLAGALAKAQGAMENAEKTAENPAFKRDGKNSTYATLASVLSAVRKPLADNGLSIVQWPVTVENGVEIETTLFHESGQYLRNILWLPCPQMTVHTVGSATTYGRRYALMAVLGVAPEDDDGNAAAGQRDGDEPHRAGPAGSASGGTDFRPPGPRRTGWAKEAEDDGTLDTTRVKGEMPGKAAPGKKSAAEKAKKWTDNAIATIKLPGQHVGSLDKWWKEQKAVAPGSNYSPLGWLEEAAPEEYERLQAAFDEVRSNAQQVAA